MILILLSLYPPLREAEEFGIGDITRLKTPSISVTYQNLFSISKLQSVKVEWNSEKYGFQLLHFGTQLYREIIIGGRYNLTIENIWIVLEPSLLYLSQNDKDNYGFNSNFMLGIMLRDYKIYLNAIHPISYIHGETIPVEMELCLIYENEWNVVGFKLDYLEDWGIGLGFGYTLKFTNFKAGIGLLTNPMIPTAGFSIDVGNICFCAGFQNHLDLGLSSTYTVYYKK